MLLINRSPGAFMVFANLVVYGVIAAEIWMWTVATTAAIVVVLALIALCAGLICRSVLHLLEDGADEVPARIRVPSARRAAAPSEAPAVTAPAAPRRRPLLHRPV